MIVLETEKGSPGFINLVRTETSGSMINFQSAHEKAGGTIKGFRTSPLAYASLAYDLQLTTVLLRKPFSLTFIHAA